MMQWAPISSKDSLRVLCHKLFRKFMQSLNENLFGSFIDDNDPKSAIIWSNQHRNKYKLNFHFLLKHTFI